LRNVNKTVKTFIITVVLLPVLAGRALAAINATIEYVNPDDSARMVVVKYGDKLMLDKEWYSYRFEINPVRNLGAVQMQAVDAGEYRRALDEVSFPVEKLGCYRVYFLGYRLKNYPATMALSFMDGSVVVFGTYFPLPAERTAQLAVHELGHDVDFKLMDKARWNEYKKLRGLMDSTIYNDTTPVYENRPQEIFAEDFRLLFGGEKARAIPHMNNMLPNPQKVEGLKEFFLELAGQAD